MGLKKKFSIVIAVAPNRNAEVVESIKGLNYPKKDYEIIIKEGLNPSENRNDGFKDSKGEIIAFIDDDAYIDPELLNNAEKFFKKNADVQVVGGPQLTPVQDGLFARISGYALSSKFGAWKISNRYSLNKEIIDADETCITSANLFCRREVLEVVKFDTKLFPGEDPKFISDAKKSGFKVSYSPSLIVYHKRRATLKDLIKQIFKYGEFRPSKEGFIETLHKPYFLVPSLFLIYLLALIVYLEACIFLGKINIIFLIPLILYLILTILFSIYDSIKNKDYKGVLFLPFVYFAIHASYGFGMICGYLKKIRI